VFLAPHDSAISPRAFPLSTVLNDLLELEPTSSLINEADPTGKGL
jgi:hypothetical protein